MSRYTRITLIILIVAIIVVVFFGIWWWFNREKNTDVVVYDAQGNPLSQSGSATNSLVVNSGSNTTANTNATTTPKPVQIDPKVAERLRAQQLAVSFVERYGSYSSQSNFANLEDLLIFMSKKYYTTTQAEIQTGRSKKVTAPTPYFGVVTKALVTKENAYDADAGTASYTISAQRRRTEVDGKTVTTTQTALLTLVKEDGTWKVDEVGWK